MVRWEIMKNNCMGGGFLPKPKPLVLSLIMLWFMSVGVCSLLSHFEN